MVPFICPGVPSFPFSTLIILHVTKSPLSIEISFPVSASIIPCPNAANLLVAGS